MVIVWVVFNFIPHLTLQNFICNFNHDQLEIKVNFNHVSCETRLTINLNLDFVKKLIVSFDVTSNQFIIIIYNGFLL